MAAKIAAVVFGIIFTLFLLSVIAPMQSQRKFWRMIHKFRAGMDLVVYWFFNVCAILTILYAVFMVTHGWVTAHGF